MADLSDMSLKDSLVSEVCQKLLKASKGLS